jgi:hypothetical protein
MLLPVSSQEPAFGFDNDAVGEVKVRRVFSLFSRLQISDYTILIAEGYTLGCEFIADLVL